MRAVDRVIKQCVRCGRDFGVLPSRAERSVYCSFECKNTRSEFVIKQCGICKVDFAVTSSKADQTKYCTRACYYEAKRRTPIPESKQCRGCGEIKRVLDFSPRKEQGGRPRSICKACVQVRYHADVEKRREKNRESYQRRRRANPERFREQSRRENFRMRAAVIKAYGGACSCCGERTFEFLSIDHINNDGAQHRREIGRSGGHAFYRWLKKNGYPRGNFQLLCYNCNAAKGFFGMCPHQRARKELEPQRAA